MISVNRTAPPKNLTRHAQRWKDELLAAIEQHQQGGKKPSDTLWDKYNKPYVRKALHEMFHDKCAYCESKISHVAYPQIEHYRPKNENKYPHLTFDWQNLLLACAKCNGKEYKGDQFPLEDNDENKPLLLNPCEDDPAQYLYFEQARLASLAASKRGAKTIEVLGLNRDELFDRRRELLRLVDYIRRAVEDYQLRGDMENTQRGRHFLNAAVAAESEYTAMVRQFMANPLPAQSPI